MSRVCIACKTAHQRLPDARQQMSLATKHPAADNDALRHHREDQVVEQHRQGVADLLPDGMLRGQLFRGDAAACLDGRSGSQTLHAISVEGAITRPQAACQARDALVTGFRVAPTAKRPPPDHGADADAGSHRHVGEGVQPACGAPAAFGERGGIHVGVEARRHPEPPQGTKQRHVVPAGLRRTDHSPKAGRIRPKIERPETCQPECGETVPALPARQHLVDLRQRLLRCPGGDTLFLADVGRPTREQADAFGAPELNPRDERRFTFQRGPQSSRRDRPRAV